MRDLVVDPLPHIDPQFVSGVENCSCDIRPGETIALARSDMLIDELCSADVLVLAAGLINYGVPSGLKAWIDHIVRRGKTFTYVEGKSTGLLKGRKVYLVEAYGGIYSEGPRKPHDYMGPYIQFILSFIGLDDIEVVAMEGMAKGSEHADRVMRGVVAQVSKSLGIDEA